MGLYKKRIKQVEKEQKSVHETERIWTKLSFN